MLFFVMGRIIPWAMKTRTNFLLRSTQFVLRFAAVVSAFFAVTSLLGKLIPTQELNIDQVMTLGYTREGAAAFVELQRLNFTTLAKFGNWLATVISLGQAWLCWKLAVLVQQYRNRTVQTLANVKLLSQMGGLLTGIYFIQLTNSLIQFRIYADVPKTMWFSVMGGIMNGMGMSNLDARIEGIALIMNTVFFGLAQLAPFFIPQLTGMSALIMASLLFFGAALLRDRIRLNGEVDALKEETELTI